MLQQTLKFFISLKCCQYLRFKYGPILASFCLFSSFSHHNSTAILKKHRCCAWDLNLGSQRRITTELWRDLLSLLLSCSSLKNVTKVGSVCAVQTNCFTYLPFRGPGANTISIFLPKLMMPNAD